MRFTVFRATLLVAASSTAMLATVASAQDSVGTNGEPAPASGPATPGTDAPAQQSGSDVVVTGTRAALESAEKTKRDSGVLIDGISADDIGELPDISVADSLVRIPGLTANDKEDGFDQVSVRGLGPDLTNTTYNGRTLPTNSQGDRRVQLGTLPSEGIGAAYVQKTSDAATIEGGLGGTIDIQSVRPLETKRHGLTVVVRGTADSILNQVDGPYGLRPLGFRGEVSLIKRIAPNLGIALTYSYLGTSNASPSTQFTNYRTSTLTRADLNGDGVPDAYPASAGLRVGANTNDRHAVLGMVQWDPVSSIRLSADGFYIKNTGNGNAIQYFADGIANPANTRPTNAAVTNSTVTAFQGQVGNYTLIENDGGNSSKQLQAGLNLAFDDGGPMKFKVDVSYARDTAGGQSRQVNIQNDTTAASTAAATAQTNGLRIPFGYDARNPNAVLFNFQPLAPEDYALNSINIGNPFRSDTTKAIRTDFTYDPHSSYVSSIAFGARVDDRLKVNSPDNTIYTYGTLSATGTRTPLAALRPDLDSGYLDSQGNPFSRVSQYLGGPSATTFPLFSLDKLEALENAPNVLVNTNDANNIAGRSSVDEITYALYGEANVRAGPLTGNIGARYFITDETVLGFTGTTEANKVLQRVRNTYRYLLPAANFKYDLTSKLDIRFAVSKTLSRPVYNNLQIGTSIDLTTIGQDLTINQGNPNLQPFTAKNVDLSAEWYPDRHTSVAVQGFYKAVTNFVTNAQMQGTITGLDGTPIPVTINTQINDPNVRHFKGIEVLARRDLDFLPGPLSNLGVRADYTHNWTDATDTFNSVTLVADPTAAGGLGTAMGGGQVVVAPNNFTPDIVNAQLFYSSKAIDLRLAYRYYTQYTRTIDNATQTHQYGQLDLSGSFNLRRNVRVLGTIRNLTKTKSLEYFSDYRDLSNSSLFRSNVYDGREFTLGLRAQF